MKARTTWIVLADGGTVKLFENNGPADGIHKIPSLSFSHDVPLAQELEDAERGRERAPVTRVHHAFARTYDPRRKNKEEFLQEHVVKLLEAAANENACDRIVLCAAPRSLGIIREHISDKVVKLIGEEVNKDYTNMPESELPNVLEQYCAMDNPDNEGVNPEIAAKML